jgi:hypothetical protein
MDILTKYDWLADESEKLADRTFEASKTVDPAIGRVLLNEAQGMLDRAVRFRANAEIRRRNGRL